ncbi:hypothetical protein NDR87_35650 [Nocardia sp. CDC159]|uniref:Uncharacterized protein n=1 Tax=Nocardia pulmonis TaxID=2951408 RepID=A0A9X2J1F2_9NOCA|nr:MULTISPECIES: hypothetical protein [Nocardia]MCM6778824.1 hypothetical protein [Nocardia pulmonis]MCM6791713.1 hypothetical protein [Nocardia sp. CDC159]
MRITKLVHRGTVAALFVSATVLGAAGASAEPLPLSPEPTEATPIDCSPMNFSLSACMFPGLATMSSAIS